jgi:hypothetical protein
MDLKSLFYQTIKPYTDGSFYALSKKKNISKEFANNTYFYEIANETSQ